MPETSIIIRTFNEERHIGNLLRAFKEQDYKDYEVIIVDSGSTDRTLDIAKKSADKIFRIESRDFTFGYSLNMGCKKAKGKYLVFVSAHVLPVDNNWLGNLIVPFCDEKTAMVYGRQIGAENGKFSEKRDFERIFGKSDGYPNNANAAIRKKFWSECSFDEYLFGLEDVEWARRLTKKGFLVRYQPTAAVYHIHDEKWPQVFNRYRREAIAAAGIGLARPPQVKPSLIWFVSRLSQDFLASLTSISPARLEEIVRFRYYQWKGTRQGWLYDKHLDIDREKYNLFYPTANKAVMIKDKHRADMEEMPLPEIKPGDILIKVSYVGVCKTDLEVYDGSLGYYRQGLAKYPIIPGHEFSGTIIRIGANNKFRERFKIGDRVVGECILSRGDDSSKKEVGVINHDGAYSQFVVLPGDFIHKIPETLDLKTACLTEPLAVVLRAKRRLASRLTPKSAIAVIGAGPIGNFCARIFNSEGHKVSVFDRNKERLKFLGNKADEVSSALVGLDKFDVIIEATGSKQVLEQILREGRSDSTILLLGFPYGGVNYNFEDAVGKEKVIIGSLGAGWDDFQEALKLLLKLNTEDFTKTVLPLKDFSRAWDWQRSAKHLKIILKP